MWVRMSITTFAPYIYRLLTHVQNSAQPVFLSWDIKYPPPLRRKGYDTVLRKASHQPHERLNVT